MILTISFPQVFQGNTDIHTIVKNTLDPPFSTRFIRLNIKQCDSYCALRMEIYGCNNTSSVNPSGELNTSNSKLLKGNFLQQIGTGKHLGFDLGLPIANRSLLTLPKVN